MARKVRVERSTMNLHRRRQFRLLGEKLDMTRHEVQEMLEGVMTLRPSVRRKLLHAMDVLAQHKT